MKKFLKFYKRLKTYECIPILVLLRAAYYWIFYRKLIFAHHAVRIKEVRRILMEKGTKVYIGLDTVKNLPFNLQTIINVEGLLSLGANVCIARGCKIGVGKHALAVFNQGVHINYNTTLHISNYFNIGEMSSVSWDCCITDSNWHDINYPGKKQHNNEITIGKNALIGFRTIICGNLTIKDGNIIQCGSRINTSIPDVNCIISTNNLPKVIKKNVKWTN